jgi:hypothetical protein
MERNPRRRGGSFHHDSQQSDEDSSDYGPPLYIPGAVQDSELELTRKAAPESQSNTEDSIFYF